MLVRRGPRGHQTQGLDWLGLLSWKVPWQSTVAFGVSEIGCLSTKQGSEGKAALALPPREALPSLCSQGLKVRRCMAQSCTQREGSGLFPPPCAPGASWLTPRVGRCDCCWPWLALETYSQTLLVPGITTEVVYKWTPPGPPWGFWFSGSGTRCLEGLLQGPGLAVQAPSDSAGFLAHSAHLDALFLLLCVCKISSFQNNSEKYLRSFKIIFSGFFLKIIFLLFLFS